MYEVTDETNNSQFLFAVALSRYQCGGNSSTSCLSRVLFSSVFNIPCVGEVNIGTNFM